MPLLVEKRQLVLPGDTLAEGDFNPGENAYREGGKIYASIVGLANIAGKNVYVVAMNSFYMPIVGDLVIGKVIDLRFSGWTIDINAPYTAILPTSEAFDRSFNSRRDEMSSYLDVGDLVVAKVIAFDRTRDPQLTIKEGGLGKVERGRIIQVTPTKIPRVIGRKGSMINMLTQETNTRITVGQNGVILVSGDKPDMETRAIKYLQMIEQEAHTAGLTNRVEELLKKERGQKVEPTKE
ncbi:exosome complex RNA-binding protein Rrp4 [Candidatus Bathyarchaeota archaeon]|nr:exosome complex RNA-binding protein Rrp4 [Candidatus Bathyarchaeota archaeon]